MSDYKDYYNKKELFSRKDLEEFLKELDDTYKKILNEALSKYNKDLNNK